MSAWPDTLAEDYVVTFDPHPAPGPNGIGLLRHMTLVAARDMAVRWPRGSRPHIVRASTGEVYQQELSR